MSPGRILCTVRIKLDVSKHQRYRQPVGACPGYSYELFFVAEATLELAGHGQSLSLSQFSI